MKIKKHIVNECISLVEDAQELIDLKLQHDVFIRETASNQLELLDKQLTEIGNHLKGAKYGRRKHIKRYEETRGKATAFAG